MNEYNTLAITRGDLLLSNTTRTFDPRWIWPTIISNNDNPNQPTEVVNYEPPPLTTVVVDTDRIPWIKPPPVQKAEQSLPGAPPMNKKSGGSSRKSMTQRIHSLKSHQKGT